MGLIKILNIDYVKANSRCLCGACNHYITRVNFSNGFTWIPTNSEFVALKEILGLVIRHNLSTDKHCFKVEQKVRVQEVLI